MGSSFRYFQDIADGIDNLGMATGAGTCREERPSFRVRNARGNLVRGEKKEGRRTSEKFSFTKLENALSSPFPYFSFANIRINYTI